MKKIWKVIVELYDLLITPRKDDRFGRVVSTGSLKVDDLIEIAVTRRTDLNAVTLKASYELLKELALEGVCGAKNVEFGLSHYSLGVEGIFIGDHAAWNAAENKLNLQSTPTLEARKAVSEITPEVRGMAQSGIYINTLTDVTSGEVNTRITPGGAVNLTGVRLKIAGDPATGTGLFLTEINSGTTTQIPSTSIAINDPSKMTFVVTPGLPPGDYRLSIVTQFVSATVQLKEPRTYVYNYVLACG